LALFGFWANMAFAITPTFDWNPTQASNYIDIQRAVSKVTGHPLDTKVVVTTRFRGPASAGTIFVQGRCEKLYLLVKTVPKGDPVPPLFLLPVERSPDTPICDSLVGAH
jgi:hypothetical protein